MVECPYCGQELEWEDVYGKNLRLNAWDQIMPGFEKSGDIYRCQNEACEAYSEHFYTRRGEELHEGYPC